MIVVVLIPGQSSYITFDALANKNLMNSNCNQLHPQDVLNQISDAAKLMGRFMAISRQDNFCLVPHLALSVVVRFVCETSHYSSKFVT